MKPQLELRNIGKRYGRIVALNHVNLKFTPGVYALLGPNGAGKSTMMKIITKTIEPDSGNIFYCGQAVQSLGEDYRAVLGYMPQQQGIYEGFKAKRFLSYMAALKGIPKNKAEKELERVLRMVHLSKNADQKLGTFSGGMKQRVLIAQAILGNPEILIFDEPTAGLDPKERIHVRNMIAQIAEKKIVLIATHIVSDIENIAKEIIIMKKGKVLGCRMPEEWPEDLPGDALTPEDLYMSIFREEGDVDEL